MIIKKQNVKKTTKKSSAGTSAGGKRNVIKKDELLDLKNVENTNENKELIVKSNKTPSIKNPDEDFEKIDISSIEFKERVERRRGDRRRGYRRIDERTLVSRAQNEAHTIKELAAREGYLNGLEKASEQIEEIKNDLIEFLNMKDEIAKDFYPHIMEISMEVAKKIIKKEVEVSPEILKEVIMETLDKTSPDAEKITVKVNSSDVEFATLSLPEVVDAKNITAKVNVVGDDTVDKGSCIIIANNGVIDANFSTQLSILQNAFGIYKGGI